MTARGCTEKQERASPSDAEGGARIFAEEKREMGHLLCFYLLELGMAAAWCRWVICREVDLPALLRTARTVWSGERQVLGELLLVRRRWTEGEETERFRQAWRRIALRLLPPLLYLPWVGRWPQCWPGECFRRGPASWRWAAVCWRGWQAAASRRGPRGP